MQDPVLLLPLPCSAQRANLRRQAAVAVQRALWLACTAAALGLGGLETIRGNVMCAGQPTVWEGGLTRGAAGVNNQGPILRLLALQPLLHRRPLLLSLWRRRLRLHNNHLGSQGLQGGPGGGAALVAPQTEQGTHKAGHNA